MLSLNTVTAIVIPDGYSSWAEYINEASRLSGIISLPTFHAGYELLGIWGLIFLGISVLGAITFRDYRILHGNKQASLLYGER